MNGSQWKVQDKNKNICANLCVCVCVCVWSMCEMPSCPSGSLFLMQDAQSLLACPLTSETKPTSLGDSIVGKLRMITGAARVVYQYVVSDWLWWASWKCQGRFFVPVRPWSFLTSMAIRQNHGQCTQTPQEDTR